MGKTVSSKSGNKLSPSEEKAKRSEAAKRAWETIRANKLKEKRKEAARKAVETKRKNAEEKLAQERFEDYRQRGFKAAETRRKNLEIKKQKYSEAGKKAAATRLENRSIVKISLGKYSREVQKVIKEEATNLKKTYPLAELFYKVICNHADCHGCSIGCSQSTLETIDKLWKKTNNYNYVKFVK